MRRIGTTRSAAAVATSGRDYQTGSASGPVREGTRAKMLRVLRFIGKEERGEDLMEYGLLVAFVATIALAVVITDPLGLGTAVGAAYQRAIDELGQSSAKRAIKQSCPRL